MEAVQNLLTLENKEDRIIDLLDRHLASAIDLQLRIRHALWNAEDPHLGETRQLSAAASEIEQFCKLIAVRLRALGAVAHVSLQTAQARSFLDAYTISVTGDQEHISAIDRALAKFRHSARQAREKAVALRDQTTAALFGKLVSAIDAQIWFLRSPSR